MHLRNYIEVGRMDELGRSDSFLHRIDARGKIITTVVFIVVVMSFKRYDVAALVPLFLYPFVLLALGRLPVGYIFRKVAITAPFAFFVGMFNPVMDSQPFMMIGAWSISGGWLSFFSIMLRFILTVSVALILVASTGIYRLCAGLESMGVPRVFALQLLFLYRYFFVIADEGLRMMRSFEMRSDGGGAMKLGVYGSLAGHLFLRSIDRAQRIYRAMAARGFEGDIRLMQPPALRLSDALFLAGWIGFFLIARWTDLSNIIGKWILEKIS